jgi:hypothetical protein
MSKHIEAEGGEILIKSSNGYMAIIPKNMAPWVKEHIKSGNHHIVDGYVKGLQEMKDGGKAQDGGKIGSPLEADMISKVLMNRNRNKDFVQRAYAVGQYPKSNMFSTFEDFDTKATHLMGYGEDDKGQTYMFPTIMNPQDEAVKIPNQYAGYISEEGYKKATKMK